MWSKATGIYKINTTKVKFGFIVPFNNQDHIGTGLQHCHLWESEVTASDYMPNLLTHKTPKDPK